MDYQSFLSQKQVTVGSTGFHVDTLNPMLFDFQQQIVKLALRKGKFCIFAGCGLGKALKNGTPVLSIDGWKPIESLNVGDKVIGSDGTSYSVTGVYPQGVRDLYRVTFSDGVTIDCDGDHLWTVKTMKDRLNGRSRTLTTKQIIQNGLTVGNKKHPPYRYSIPMVQPIKSPVVDLPLDPYFLGAMLGDGGISGAQYRLTTDDEIVSGLSMPQYSHCRLANKLSCGYISEYSINSTAPSKGNQFSNPVKLAFKQLGLDGCLSHKKFIPPSYLCASIEQRWSLLQGLLDTDGSFLNCSGKDAGVIEYSTSSSQLKDGVVELVQSLGGTATVGIKKNPHYTDKDGNRIYCKDSWRIIVKTPTQLGCPFRLKRKAEKYRPSIQRPEPYRMIRAIQQIDPDLATCISVDSPDKLFVAQHHVLTHNTSMQLEWANQVVEHTGGKVLLLAPLAVATQTVREAEKFEIESTVGYARSQKDASTNIVIANYEMMSKFDASKFDGVVLDESSILKSFNGKTRNEILETFAQTPYRLACSATPAPNDYMELGNHAEFVGAMSREEMLAMFFTHDGGTTSQWRLKGHAEEKFWEWMASWSVMIRSPKDLGFDSTGFDLPPLRVNEIVTKTHLEPTDGQLFFVEATTLIEQRKVRKASIDERVQRTAELVNNSSEQWLVWCDLNEESEKLTKAIADAVEVKGSDSNEHKESAMMGFSEGKHRVLVTKSSIAGFGMNWQNCHNMVFVGMSHSWEAYYQAVRRCWRFGQVNDVTVHIVYDHLEGAVIRNIERKEKESKHMADQMVRHMMSAMLQEMQLSRTQTGYIPTVEMIIPDWLKSETLSSHAPTPTSLSSGDRQVA